MSNVVYIDEWKEQISLQESQLIDLENEFENDEILSFDELDDFDDDLMTGMIIW